MHIEQTGFLSASSRSTATNGFYQFNPNSNWTAPPFGGAHSGTLCRRFMRFKMHLHLEYPGIPLEHRFNGTGDPPLMRGVSAHLGQRSYVDLNSM